MLPDAVSVLLYMFLWQRVIEALERIAARRCVRSVDISVACEVEALERIAARRSVHPNMFL